MPRRRNNVVPFPGNRSPKPAERREAEVWVLEDYRNARNTGVSTHYRRSGWIVRVEGRVMITKSGRARRFRSHYAAFLAGIAVMFGEPALLAPKSRGR